MSDQHLDSGGFGEKVVPWTDQQREYVKLRIAGRTMGAAAAEVGIHHNTATKWEKKPELNIGVAIDAGIELRKGMGDKAAIAEVANTISNVCTEVSAQIAAPMVMKMLVEKKAVERAIHTLLDVMDDEKSRGGDRVRAAQAILDLTGVQQTIKMSQTQTTEISRGLTETGQEEIEQDLLGVHLRQQVWEGMRIQPTDPEMPSDR